jgi:hypothetical protein
MARRGDSGRIRPSGEAPSVKNVPAVEVGQNRTCAWPRGDGAGHVGQMTTGWPKGPINGWIAIRSRGPEAGGHSRNTHVDH